MHNTADYCLLRLVTAYSLRQLTTNTDHAHTANMATHDSIFLMIEDELLEEIEAKLEAGQFDVDEIDEVLPSSC